MKRMFFPQDKLNKRLVQTAAAFAAAVLASFTLVGCAMFRPADGVGRDTSLSSESLPVSLTDKAGESDTTIAADTTAPHTSSDQGNVTAPPVTTETKPPETTPPETDPPKPTEKRVSVVAVGDNMIHEAVYIDAQKRASDGVEYSFLPMYSTISDKVKGADIAFVNHESPMAGKQYGISGYPTFNAPQEVGQALVDAGFDVINLANNHILDKRAAGARATAEFVRTLPVTSLGVYLDQKDYETIRVTEVNGIRIAWLSFMEKSNNAYDPKTSSVIIPMLNNDNTITARIKEAHKVADFVIVSAHWGAESDKITNEQRRLAKVMTEAGADVIIGHHSHVLQSVEWLTSASGEKTLVAYSLGNFLSSQLYAKNMIGGMLCFDIVMDQTGKCSLENPVMDITVNHYAGKKDSTDPYGVYRHAMQMYLLEDYTEAMAAEHGCRFFSSNFSRQWIEKHVRSIIAEEFLPACLE